jgi:hypothetical protein
MINGSFDASKYVFNARNPHFKRALELRRDGKYKEAGKELMIAADVDGDLEALIMQREALRSGGFGIKRLMEHSEMMDFLRSKDLRHVAINYYRKKDPFVLALTYWDDVFNYQGINVTVDKCIESFKNGNALAIYFVAQFFGVDTLKQCIPFIKLGSELGDATCCYCMVKYLDLSCARYVQTGFKQFYQPMGAHWRNHVNSNNISLDEWYWYILNFDEIGNIESETETRTTKRQYQIGRWVQKRYLPILKKSPYTRPKHWNVCLQQFKTINQQCQQSVFCFLFYFKPILGKDVTKLIAQRIWKSRKEEPELWNQDEEQEKKKKIKRG